MSSRLTMNTMVEDLSALLVSWMATDINKLYKVIELLAPLISVRMHLYKVCTINAQLSLQY